MDLKNGNITLGEVLRNPNAANILNDAFPGIMNNRMMMRMGYSMTLNKIVSHARGRVPQWQLNNVIDSLKQA
ncbi:MAG: hypothetical protein VB078_04995 [Clostridiaceae bacterium]|nr:hypothetical protein [Clostridiaceae bacterium]